MQSIVGVKNFFLRRLCCVRNHTSSNSVTTLAVDNKPSKASRALRTNSNSNSKNRKRRRVHSENETRKITKPKKSEEESECMEIASIFNTSSENISCLYIFSLGPLESVVHNMPKEYKDLCNSSRNYQVVKYGRTDNLARRFGEHRRDFKTIGITPKLMKFTQLDQAFLAEAETEVKNYLVDLCENGDCAEFVTEMGNKKRKEIIILDKTIVTALASKYRDIGAKYNLREEIKNQKHMLELLEKDRKIGLLQKELEVLKSKE